MTSGSDLGEPAVGGELVIDEKPQLDPVRLLLEVFSVSHIVTT
jgi:hypothetical protein